MNINEVQLEQWDVADIKPYPYNHKKHPEKQIEVLMKSISRQGLLDPIAIDGEGVIISGHGRFEAIKRLGWKKVTVRPLRGLTPEQASALRIAANKTVSNEYDTDMLQRELQALMSMDFDIDGLGFDDKELAMLTADVGEIDDDAITFDIEGAVEAHEADVQERSEKVDEDTVRVEKALGFKSISLKDQKVVSRFMAVIEDQTGAKGSEALLIHMRQQLGTA